MKSRRSRRRLRLGDVVCNPDDPRHTGKVVELFGGLGTTRNDLVTVTVKWPNGWTEKFEHNDLELVTARQEGEAMSGYGSARFNPNLRPKTLGESPRAELERWLLKQRGE
jgi:hypothetical protein